MMSLTNREGARKRSTFAHASIIDLTHLVQYQVLFSCPYRSVFDLEQRWRAGSEGEHFRWLLRTSILNQTSSQSSMFRLTAQMLPNRQVIDYRRSATSPLSYMSSSESHLQTTLACPSRNQVSTMVGMRSHAFWKHPSVAWEHYLECGWASSVPDIGALTCAATFPIRRRKQNRADTEIRQYAWKLPFPIFRSFLTTRTSYQWTDRS